MSNSCRTRGRSIVELRPCVQDVRVADAGRRVGVELEELDVVARQERVEAADAHRPREAGVDPDQRVLHRRDARARRAAPRPAGRRRRSGPARADSAPTACLTRRSWPGEMKCGISTNGIVWPAKITSCSSSQASSSLLEPRAAVTELGELDEVLQLEVVDVVDQGASGPTDWGAPLLLRGYRRVRTRPTRSGCAELGGPTAARAGANASRDTITIWRWRFGARGVGGTRGGRSIGTSAIGE